MKFMLRNPGRTALTAIACIVLAVTVVKAADMDFEFERVDPDTINKHPAYAQVTTVRGDAKFIYVAGQVDRPIDYTPRSNRCRHNDMRGQYLGTMENVGKALESVGADWNDVVFIRRYITDWRAWRIAADDKENPLPNYWEGHRPPPSTMIQVVALSEPCQMIEIDVFAAIPDAKAE